MLENTIEEKQKTRENQLKSLDLDGLDELEDSEDEAVLLEYRNKRIAELRALTEKPKFGYVREISGQDYVNEVNKAGDGIYVVLHLYRQGIPLCNLINQFMNQISMKFPYTKFLKSIASTCIPNFPEKNLPTVFVYFEGQMKQQFIGPVEFRGTNLTYDEFEFLIGKSGAVDSDIKEDPKQAIKDKMFADLADTNDW